MDYKDDNLDFYKDVMHATAEQYIFMFLFDLKKQQIYDVKNDINYKISENDISIQKKIHKEITYYTALESVQKMRRFTDLSTLSERLKDKKVISNIFHGKDYSWFNSKFAKIGTEEPLRYVLYFVEKVDEQLLDFQEQRREIIENKKLHKMLDALIDEYNTVCTVDFNTHRVEFSQLSDRLKESFFSAKKVGLAEELAAMYIEMGVCESDRENLKKILTIDFVENNIKEGSSFSCTFRNDLGEYMEMRIFRSSHNSVFLGFKDKNLEIEEINNKIYTDSLTGVKNRKYYDEQVADQTCEAAVICDIDNFKRINDTYGHQFGDYVIAIVASTLKSCLRKSDDVIRYGGDEFVVSFEEIPYDTLKKILEKIRIAVENIRLEEYPELRLSMSFGAAYGNEIINKMLSEADNALYESKKNRNSVTIKQAEKGKKYLLKQMKNDISED